MNTNENANSKSEETIDTIAQYLRDMANDVEAGNCNDPVTNLFDADAFNVSFNEQVQPFVKSVKDNQKMD